MGAGCVSAMSDDEIRVGVFALCERFRENGNYRGFAQDHLN